MSEKLLNKELLRINVKFYKNVIVLVSLFFKINFIDL